MTDSSRTGVLVVNLGTPDNPSLKAVRKFLGEFLSDPRVINYPRLLWLPILYGVILRIRPKKTAHAYAQIWTKEGSPLLLTSRALERALEASLGAKFITALGMTYGSPSIASGLKALRDAKVKRIVVIPLYPQFSYTTTGSVRDRVEREMKTWSQTTELIFIDRYYDESRYLDALANSIRDFWALHGQKHLFFSFHGIPQSYVDNGDPYYEHCMATARGVVERLRLTDRQWTVAFQSRVTKAKWLEPYTDKTLLQFAASGPKDISVVCPAFATDNLETLEEIAIRNREDFLSAGGSSLDYIPCLNESPAHVELFKQLVEQCERFSPIEVHR